MDDPWGSPWATNEKSESAPSTLTLEPPPRALLSSRSRSSSKNNLSPVSPWDKEDDAFGDWASGDVTDATSTNLNPWAAWADVSQQPSPRRDSPKKESLATWPASTSSVPSPSIQPLPQSHSPLASTPNLSRQPSFDPWKSDAPADIPIEAPTSLDTRVDPSSVCHERQSSKDAVAVILPQPDARPEMEDMDASPVVQGNLINSHPTARTSRDTNRNRTSGRNSRASSRSSKSGARDQFAKDSPITSVDDDPKEAVARGTPANKVQELVDMYDGLAKKQHTSNSESLQPVRKRPAPRSDATQDDDFGDFEDAGSQDDASVECIDDQIQPGRASVQSPEETSSWVDEPRPWSLEVSSPPSPSRPRVRSAKLKIDVPMDALDNFLPPPKSLPKTSSISDEDHSIDHIIYDTFAEISERRTWFRISRFGSMLRNDAPDFENYTSVQWSHTKTHEETLHIVKRWMQGNTHGASGTNGNGSSGGFGWDSAAPTVSLEDIFGRKRPQNIFTSSHGGILQPIAAPLKSPVSATKSSASPTTATFAWSSSPTGPKASTEPPQSSHQKHSQDVDQNKPPIDLKPCSMESPTIPKADFKWGSFEIFESKEPPQNKLGISNESQAPTSDIFNVEKGPPPKLGTNVTKNAASAVADAADDDDWGEWGEMVSSPTLDAVPFQPQAKLKPTGTQPPRGPEEAETKANNISEAEQRILDELISRLPDLSWMLR